jgi:hypothetical protein
MRVLHGVNPDFADFDEIDTDAAEALEEFDQGVITLDELRHLIGPDAARARAQIRYEDPESFFDDPGQF